MDMRASRDAADAGSSPLHTTVLSSSGEMGNSCSPTSRQPAQRALRYSSESGRNRITTTCSNFVDRLPGIARNSLTARAEVTVRASNPCASTTRSIFRAAPGTRAFTYSSIVVRAVRRSRRIGTTARSDERRNSVHRSEAAEPCRLAGGMDDHFSLLSYLMRVSRNSSCQRASSESVLIRASCSTVALLTRNRVVRHIRESTFSPHSRRDASSRTETTDSTVPSAVCDTSTRLRWASKAAATSSQ